MKVCTQCKEEKSYHDFPKRKTSKDGLYSWCKQCSSRRTRKYNEENPEKVKITREKRRERALKVAREYKEKHKERLSKQRKVYYYENREKLLLNAREYAKNLSQEEKKKKREYYKRWSKTENAKKYNKSRKDVFRALKKGVLVKPNKCTLCFCEKKLEAHHPDYNKTLDVVWLCKKCHGKVHRNA